MDVIVTNARIVTMNSGGLMVDALAVQDGKIMAVGSADEIMTHRQPDAMVIDAEAKTVLPGFSEPRNHMIVWHWTLGSGCPNAAEPDHRRHR